MPTRKLRNPLAPLAAAAAGEFILAPAVIAMRGPLLAAEALQAGPWGPETMRAVTEKMAAMSEGMAQAQLSAFGSMLGAWQQLALGQTPMAIAGAAFERSLEAALRPAGKQVRANYRRLSRHKKP